MNCQILSLVQKMVIFDPFHLTVSFLTFFFLFWFNSLILNVQIVQFFSLHSYCLGRNQHYTQHWLLRPVFIFIVSFPKHFITRQCIQIQLYLYRHSHWFTSWWTHQRFAYQKWHLPFFSSISFYPWTAILAEEKNGRQRVAFPMITLMYAIEESFGQCHRSRMCLNCLFICRLTAKMTVTFRMEHTILIEHHHFYLIYCWYW